MLLFVLLTLPLLAASRSLNCVCKDSNVSLKVVPGPEGNTISDEIFQSPAESNGINLLYNWRYTDDLRGKKHDAMPKLDAMEKYALCPNNWIRFQESCYYIVKDRIDQEEATKRCFAKNSTLFVANSIEEWETLRKAAPMVWHSWVGLNRIENATNERPTWQTIDGMDTNDLNWLVKPYSMSSNGWNSVSRCVAHYNPEQEPITYVYYYPCNALFFAICERNATFVNMQHDRQIANIPY